MITWVHVIGTEYVLIKEQILQLSYPTTCHVLQIRKNSL